MPWIPYCSPPGEAPAHYAPVVYSTLLFGDFKICGYLSDDVVLGKSYLITYAKEKRKEAANIREGLLLAQKMCGKEDRQNAKELSHMAADYMKQYRAWDAAIKYMEGDPAMHHHYCPPIQEEIAPYLDRVFGDLSYCVVGEII